MINGEELPIVMFLTTVRTEIENQGANQQSPMLAAEIDDLFTLSTSDDQISYIFSCHVSSLVSRRNESPDPVQLLKHCYKIAKSLELEQFFNQSIKKRLRLQDNDVFRNLERQDEPTLIQMVGSCTLAY